MDEMISADPRHAVAPAVQITGASGDDMRVAQAMLKTHLGAADMGEHFLLPLVSHAARLHGIGVTLSPLGIRLLRTWHARQDHAIAHRLAVSVREEVGFLAWHFPQWFAANATIVGVDDGEALSANNADTRAFVHMVCANDDIMPGALDTLGVCGIAICANSAALAHLRAWRAMAATTCGSARAMTALIEHIDNVTVREGSDAPQHSHE